MADQIASSGIEILQAHHAVDVSVQTGLTPDARCAVLPAYDGLIVRSATAVCVVNVDSAIPPEVLDAIRDLPNLIYAKTVNL
jgi:hypothetical protein